MRTCRRRDTVVTEQAQGKARISRGSPPLSMNCWLAPVPHLTREAAKTFAGTSTRAVAARSSVRAMHERIAGARPACVVRQSMVLLPPSPRGSLHTSEGRGPSNRIARWNQRNSLG